MSFLVPSKDGVTDLDYIKEHISDKMGVIVSPNYFGIIEDYMGLSDIVHDAGSTLMMNQEGQSLAILKSPGNLMLILLLENFNLLVFHSHLEVHILVI